MAVLLLVLALLLRVTWVQVADETAFARNDNNRRNAVEQYAHPFGDIVAGGKAVTGSARTTGGDLTYRRTPAHGPLYAPVTGFSSQVRGQTQSEGTYKDVLHGTDPRLENPLGALTGDRPEPGDVLTTADPGVQRAAMGAPGDKKGAAVAIDPSGGRIPGTAGTPSYDPSKTGGSGKGDAGEWRRLAKDPDRPTLDRALRQPVPPGSTFRPVVAPWAERGPGSHRRWTGRLSPPGCGARVQPG